MPKPTTIDDWLHLRSRGFRRFRPLHSGNILLTMDRQVGNQILRVQQAIRPFSLHSMGWRQAVALNLRLLRRSMRAQVRQHHSLNR